MHQCETEIQHTVECESVPICQPGSQCQTEAEYEFDGLFEIDVDFENVMKSIEDKFEKTNTILPPTSKRTYFCSTFSNWI